MTDVRAAATLDHPPAEGPARWPETAGDRMRPELVAAALAGDWVSGTPLIPAEDHLALSATWDDERPLGRDRTDGRAMAVEPESRAPQVRVERASQSGGLHAGQILGQERYLLRERLGSGRAAAVWRAFDRMLTIDVAVKVLHPGLGRDAGHRETFFRRARKTAESDHDAVVRIVEPYGADRGHYYFVMELAVGGTLHTAVVERGVGPEQSIPWIMRTGDALSAAHRRGCMHLDIKPSNVLLTDEHEARLADFDLIIEADATADMIAWRWARGEASGAYLAPEQLDGSPRVVSGRADIYGLAMTTAFALHGHALPAQAARDTSAFMAGLHCAGPVRDVLTRATRHEPERRFAAMSDFCTALGDAWSQSASRAA